jgi:UDP-N-acetylmuramate dehydrogenase
MINNYNLPNIKGSYKFNNKIINWFDLKGTADVLYKPTDYSDLEYFLKNLDSQIPVQIIGAGSNVIISDDGVRGVLIKLPASFANISHDENSISAYGATPCQNLALYCQKFGLGGLEFLSGIPGNVGGAIAMNAGCYGSDISQILLMAEAFDLKGNFYKFNNKDFNFYYRGHKLNQQYIFTKATFIYKKSSSFEISEKINKLQEARAISQPIKAKTGGSTFKNPPNMKAWELIDAVGFRGKSIGDAQFSEKHCNFLINKNQANANDLIQLGNSAKKEVLNKFNINLEWEIKFIK